MTAHNKVQIFDTTLRDGEQCPGASMNLRQKLEIARQLERLGVDVIEAGFPVISDGDFTAVQTIATEIKKCRIAGLARCVQKDIEAAGRALAPAGDRAVIHVFLATSPIHREFKLGKSKEEIIEMAVAGVKLAKSFTPHVEFSAEDASRTEHEYLAQVTEAVIEAGATVVNVPDTVGYTTPDEYFAMIDYLKKHVKNVDKAILSVHCHNDLGLAVANSLAAVKAGARQVEGTINGIGERAGNVALEEVIMCLSTRPEVFGGALTTIDKVQIVKTSRLVSRMSGMKVNRSKAIVGENAFAHGSGIHQDGMLKNRATYEIMTPESVGWGATELPLTKHSGRHAVKLRLEQLGHVLSDAEMATVFERFKQIGDRKKFVYDDDLATLVNDSIGDDVGTGEWSLDYVQFTAGVDTKSADGASKAMALVGITSHDKSVCETAKGNGVVDAIFKAIDKLTKVKGKLVEYTVNSTSEGKDAMGDVTVKVDFGLSRVVTGKGASTDVLEASARAYLNALNRSIFMKARGEDASSCDSCHVGC